MNQAAPGFAPVSEYSLDVILRIRYTCSVSWNVIVTDEFHAWYDSLGAREIGALEKSITLLRDAGPSLGRPYADVVRGSRHVNMKELRVQARGHPLRVLFAFDPRRTAVLLIGGDKTGNSRFYETMIRLADRLFDEHLAAIGEAK